MTGAEVIVKGSIIIGKNSMSLATSIISHVKSALNITDEVEGFGDGLTGEWNIYINDRVCVTPQNITALKRSLDRNVAVRTYWLNFYKVDSCATYSIKKGE